MADEIKLKAPTVEQQVVVNINGEDKIKSFADTLDKISNNKNLQKYWKNQQDLINATADAYSNFQKKASKDNASELIKVTNALKAMSGTDLSHILPDFDKISKSIAEAQKVAGNIDSAFSVKGFKEAFDSFETLKAYGTDIQKLFSHFGVSSDIGELQQNVRLLEGEVEKLTRRLINVKNANEELRNEFENFKAGSGFADKLDELDRLKAEMQNIREEAIQTFNQFLDANKIDRYDWFSDDRFAEYFEKLENGTLTATDAIRRFKSEYSYLLEDSYKSNGDSFGLDQLQAFSTKLDSIFHQVEETSNKINDIISNGVIAKSVQNLSEDTTLPDSQRSIFGNILQDEESLKSITALFQKLIDETNQPNNTEVFNTEQFTKIESLFTSIESSLSSIKGVLVDVGDGEELSPLLKQLDNIREATSNIKLSLNLDLGNEVSERLNQKVSQSTQRQLEAYRKLFSAMKGTGKTNKEMLKFFEPDEASATELIGAYQGIIKRAEEKFKVGNSNAYKKLLGSTYDDLKKEIKNANAQLGRAENKRSENGILRDLFGNSKDLSGVIEQLNTIVSKLDEISVSAKGFAETFKNGLNVNASVDEIEKLTNRVKELESELTKIKAPTTVATPQESNISNGMKDAFPSTGTKLDEAVASAKDLDKTLEQVDIPTDSFNEVLKKLNLTKSELVDIVKITEKSSADKDGKFHTSYTLKDSRGSTEIYGINSKTDKGQLLDHNIVRYDVKKDTVDNSKELLEIEKQLQKEIESSDKANQKKFQDFQKEQANYEESVNKVNSAIQKTDQILDTLPLHDKLDIQFLDMIDSIDNLNSKLKSGELTLSEYKNEVKSVTSEYSKMVDIQQKRDVDEYNANAKANAEAAKLAEAKAKSRQADKDSTQSSVDKALKEQVAAWKNIQSIREKISKTNDSNEIANLQQVKKEYQQNYIEADKILKANSSLYDKENQIAKLEQIRLDTNKKIADYQNKQISGYDTRLEAYTKKTSGYDATIARFKDGGWTSDAYLKNVQAVKNAVDEYETLLKELKGKDASLVTSDDISRLDNYEKKIKDTIATVTNMSASEKGYNFVSGQKELDKIHKLLAENSKMSSEAKAKIRAYYAEIESGNPSMSLDKIHGEILKIYNAEVEAGRAGKTLWDTLKNSGFHQIAAQMAGMFGVYDVINLGKQAFSTVKELDYALVDLKKTTAMNSSELEQFYYDSNDVAKQMGVTTKEIIDQASSWSRLGYNSKQAATEMAKLSSQFALISPGMDTTTSQEGLVSIMKAWNIGYQDVKSQIMDDINALGNAMAEDNQDIVEGMERSAAALAAVGTSTKDAFALFSGIQEVLQNSEKSGTSLRSVALRLRSFDESTEEYSSDLANITGELADLTKTAEHAQGVSVFKPGSTTEFKSLVDYFREIADIWDEMSQKQQNDFLLKAFGRTQAQAGAALIQNFKGVEKALDVMDNAAGSADKEMETAKQSITYKLNELKQTWVGTVQDIANRDDLGKIVDGLTDLSSAIGFVIDKLGLVGTIGLFGGAGTGIFKFIKNFDWVFKPYTKTLSNSF